MQKEIKHIWHFNQSPQEVWAYLTRPELLEQWLTKTDFQPIVGHKFSFFDKSGKVISCQVLGVNPPVHLSYSWQAYSAQTKQPFDSKVVWTLVPEQSGTELQLVHNGFTALEDYIAHNDGWTRLGTRFVEVLNVIKK